MKAKEIFEQVEREGRNTLSEAEAKAVLKEYGIPVVEECVVQTEEEAIAAARRFGFPVVLKGLGVKLTHKTERNLVHINVRAEEQLRQAAKEIIQSAGEDLEGFLLQPMIKGKRELVAGLFHDPNFGPVVMFGLGGIFTETMGDVAFRLVPAEKPDIISMLGTAFRRHVGAVSRRRTGGKRRHRSDPPGPFPIGPGLGTSHRSGH